MNKKNGGGGESDGPERDGDGSDHWLWEFVTRSIRPLPGRSSRPNPSGGGSQPLTKPARGDRQTPITPIPDFGLKPVEAGPPSAAPIGLDRRTAERLRKGQMQIDAVLDLHGLRQGEAQERLTRFILSCQASGCRCVLVITGKGSRSPSPDHQTEAPGILRRMVPVWLTFVPLADLILSHSPAKPRDGGDGAMYVLLRRKR